MGLVTSHYYTVLFSQCIPKLCTWDISVLQIAYKTEIPPLLIKYIYSEADLGLVGGGATTAERGKEQLVPTGI